MTKRYGWTKRVLINIVEAQTYEKYLLNQTDFDLTLPEECRVQAKLAVNDEYTFDFVELSPEYSEHELEMQLENNIRAFLIEMGGDFTFIGNQYHLVVESRDLYIDLLLFLGMKSRAITICLACHFPKRKSSCRLMGATPRKVLKGISQGLVYGFADKW